ncbi:MAG: transposase [Bacteroidales bacterium]|nr:transposase [Bacteroidales bacterium]
MSRKYKFKNNEGIYFISFATICWIDVFIRDIYFAEFAESLEYCRKNKGLELFSWCIMPSHVHLIFRDKNKDPGKLIKELKTYTSKKLQKLIQENPKESRKSWMLLMMEQAGLKNSNVKNRQFWQQHNHPVELWSAEIIQQKVDYIHNNPVVAGFVTEPHFWKYSSATNFNGETGIIEIDEL